MIEATVRNSTGERDMVLPESITDFEIAFEYASQFGNVVYLFDARTGAEQEFTQDEELRYDYEERPDLVFLPPEELERVAARQNWGRA